jgi:hypothetical protein
MPRLRQLAVLWPLLLGANCHESGGAVPLGELEARAAEAICEYATRCESFPNVAACKASLSSRTGQLIASVNAGRLAYDGNAAAACLDALRATGCNLTDPPEDAEVPCFSTFKGTLAAGAACYINEECASGSCSNMSCPSASACCTGACEDLPVVSSPLPAGGDCSRPNVVCAPGTYCNYAGSSSVCTVGPAQGEACDPAEIASGRCLNHAVCVASGSALGGTCTAPPAEGETCDPNGGGCNSSLDYCDPAAAKCVRKLAPGMACPTGSECVDYASCLSGTCVALKRLGEACDDTLSIPACLGALYCSSGVCVPENPPPVCP